MSQRTHGVTITSLLRQNDVATSFWRKNDVIITPRVRWVVADYYLYISNIILIYCSGSQGRNIEQRLKKTIYSYVIWAPWRLELPRFNWFFLTVCSSYTQKNIKVPYYWPLCEGIQRWCGFPWIFPEFPCRYFGKCVHDVTSQWTMDVATHLNCTHGESSWKCFPWDFILMTNLSKEKTTWNSIPQ